MFPRAGGQTLGNIIEKQIIIQEANFVSATMFPRMGKQGNI
jgi:hypothetical protein